MSESRIFGYRPRLTLHHDFCAATSLAKDYPKEHFVFTGLSDIAEKMYMQYAPAVYEKHQKESMGIAEEYRIQKGIFSSGIVNKNNMLKYHHDTGNFTGVYSCMFVLKKDIEGGYLVLPEYDIAIELKDKSILIFDGQSIVHGVSPIFYQTPSAYRYSIVLYTLKQMKKCLPFAEELKRIQQVKTQREKVRFHMPAEHRQKLLDRWGKQ